MSNAKSYFKLPSSFIELLNELDPGVTVIINEQGHLIVDLKLVTPSDDFVPTEFLRELPSVLNHRR